MSNRDPKGKDETLEMGYPPRWAYTVAPFLDTQLIEQMTLVWA